MLVLAVYGAVRTLGAPVEETDNAAVDARVIPLSFRVGGQIAAVRVADNARVKKGDVLIELDSAEAQARLLQAEGELAAAEAQAAQSEARLAQARITSARAALTLARLALTYTTVAAPEDGTVAQLELSPGQLVLAGQRVAELVTDSTYAVANFKETQMARIRQGQPVTVTVDTYPGVKLRGRVESIKPGTGSKFSVLAPDNSLGNFVKVTQRVPVKVAWEQLPPEVTLRPGMTAEVRVDVSESP
ncbi:HlyD family secretion protein [Cystobacter fuscus]|uniref:HlyD family secretion protein n=1 Tax=Cystobacter fuscus TaxID=43 RepID=UPI0037C08F8C